MITVTMKCNKHPRYAGILVPTINCIPCQDVWDLREAAVASGDFHDGLKVVVK